MSATTASPAIVTLSRNVRAMRASLSSLIVLCTSAALAARGAEEIKYAMHALIGSAEYIELAMHTPAAAAATTSSRGAVKCSAHRAHLLRAKQDYERALAQEGLRSQDLGFGTIVSRTSAVLIGFFTSFVYTQIAGIASGSKTWQMATVSLSVTLVALAAQRFYLRTVGVASFAANRSWAAVWMQFMHFFTIIMVFLTTNFGLAVFTDMTRTSQLTWYESIALVYVSMLSFFYFMNAYKKSASIDYE